MQQVTNFGRFYGLLKLMPGMDQEELKAQLVSQWTSGRTTSLREVTHDEYQRMCDYLEYKLNLQGNNKSEAYKAERRHRRSICLRLLQKIGVDTTEWDAVNSYCKSPKIAGKVFGELNLDDLDRLSLKLRMILKKQSDK